ncbi:MAG: hypothetical protein J5594_05485 [Elusimicrobiaceae bacterium]|nr:hypothetical protein [Elusimicrobiaceae bacterium]
MIRFISPMEYQNYVPPANKQAQAVYDYVKPFIENGSSKLIANVDTEVWLAQVDDILMPVTKNTTQYENSYVCSFFSHYISYCKEEMDIVGVGILKYLFIPLLSLLGWIAKLAEINKAVILNNFMLSTNLYVPVSKEQYKQLVLAAQEKFPDFLIAFRSLNEDYNAQTLADLTGLGGIKIASRRVYLLKPKNIRTKARNHLRKDTKMWNTKGYYWELATLADIRDMDRFYSSLYLEKYSKFNPQFTPAYYQHMINNKLFYIRMLKQKESNKGVCGLFCNGLGATPPIFGYDTKSDKSEGIYRALSLWGWQMIQENIVKQMNFSSGVSMFKRTRGAVGRTEYTVLFNKHLSYGKRLFWKVFAGFINHIALPFMIWRKY